jgi:hypothetical protein
VMRGGKWVGAAFGTVLGLLVRSTLGRSSC